MMVCACLAVLLFGTGLWLALKASPADYRQGELVRMMYIHVPAAWLALLGYVFLGLMSFIYFIWRISVADSLAKAVAMPGAVLAALTLLTGSLWGKPTWGAWWANDPRLVSMLILLLFYLGYLALRASLEQEGFAARAGAVLAMVGLVNIPIVKFSVSWWSSLHQPASVLRFGGPAIHISQLTPLLVMAGAYACWLACVVLLGARADILERQALMLNRQEDTGGL